MAISIADSSCSSPRSSLGFLLDPVKVEPQLPRPKQSMWHRLGLRRWLGRDDRDFSSRSPASASSDSSPASHDRSRDTNSPPPPKSHGTGNLTRRLSRRVGVGLPRSTTSKRQHSERRDRLSPVSSEPRRAASADRRTLSLQRTKSPQSVVDPRLSAPEINWPREHPTPDLDPTTPSPTKVDDFPEANEEYPQDCDARSEWDQYPEVTDTPEGYPVDYFDMELERRWILNLSMHFRDRSEREKFFVTYAETANRWRRVTISCDYRDAEPESLEQDLKELRYQRDKCARIYESIRESLSDIQFYDTVTNLKLETRDGRLHVHVTEDVNEIIPYPPISSIGHLPEAQLIPERRLNFEAHLSGFVYNVRLGDRSFIKKEIPGPDTVDEFLYEINALHALQGTPNVIQVEGIVVDDRQEVVKGLLISFAEKGALVDILYEYRGTISWERRERWAKQIVHGLCEIHEAGYVQGDFTLSNIVVDGNDDAKIIDINRRGCPVGWEPPEIAAKIESNQRISMYIGVKTDLYQLGMTLWALAMEEDEPERQRRPFVLDENVPVPDYYRRLVSICLSPIPRQRLSAKELLSFFPFETGTFDQLPRRQPHTSIGVGLFTNGALPLYDSRASFMYPRGRQMGSFGHCSTHTSRQPPLDSFECIPSPETDVSFVDREEPGRQTELYDAGSQQNGAWKGSSMIFDDRDSVSNSVSATMDPRSHQDNRYQRSPPIEFVESEIDLDAGVDPRYRTPSTDITTVDPMLNDKPLPNELAGVGSSKPSSRNSSIHYQPSEPVSTQAPVDIYPLHSEDSVAENLSGQGPSESVSTLLQSALPINPAAEFEQGTFTTTDNQLSPSLTLGSAQEDKDQQGIYLRESSLTISLGLKLSEEALNRYEVSQPPPNGQLTFECPQGSLQGLSLSDPLLPINPAAKLPNVEHPGAGDQSNPTTEASKHSLQVIQEQNPTLSESQLPIKPAIESPKESCALETDPARTSDVQSTQHTARDQEHDCSVSGSQLPTNQATTSPEQTVNHPIENKPAVSVQLPPPQHVGSDQDERSFLSNSALPINPATSFPEKLEKTSTHPTETKSVASVRSTPCVESVSPNQHENPFLADSKLPINPAIMSPEAISHETENKPALNVQFTSGAENLVRDQSPILSKSHLPVNPATISPADPNSNKATNDISRIET
ncbi:uncharacterized protein BDV17DRAFT_112240 [Aspergillus undulatus]|uniref:uncharacterized protein n=1 Tax=Aspergillus undulatus TaxID=1810928 RepID=UPI003CCDE54E